ncbi:hypothetical protein ABFS83_09G079800 [Erythranthe nasuta]
MALLTIVRRLQLLRPCQLLRVSLSSAHRFIPSPLPPSSAMLCFSQAFHQTPCRQCKHTPHSACRRPYEIMDFSAESAEGTRGEIRLGLEEIRERVQKARDFASGDEAVAFLDDSDVRPDKDFIFSLIWDLREEWKLAFLVYKWGERWDCVVEKTCCLMIWLLGNHGKFGTAWTLVHELYRASKDTQQAMLILIDRYAAANNPDKAIETFHLMQKFKFSPEQKTYFVFLNILCKHGNIEEAEQFMYLNKKFSPLETESFNIILNGWCNIATDVYEAKRIWREMSKCCIEPDGNSYTHMISCFSTVGNLFDSLRLYDEMKKRGWVPGLEVYHSLIYVLTRENCSSEALKTIDRMKETGLKPNSATYNLVIRPLCEAEKFEDARIVLARMLEDDISPTIETYHELLKGETLEGTLGVLSHMRKSRLGPSRETFLLILDKFLKTGQSENALKIWSEMNEYEIKPDREHYKVLVEGFAKCGLIAKAKEFYSEMTSSFGLNDDPSLKKLLEEPVRKEARAKKGEGQMTIVRRITKGNGLQRGRRSSLVRIRKNR